VTKTVEFSQSSWIDWPCRWRHYDSSKLGKYLPNDKA